jgi:hypothetical protein
MPKAKLITAVMVAAVALSAATAGSATAAEWFVNGTKLSGSAALAPTTSVVTPPVFNVVNLKIKVQCNASSLIHNVLIIVISGSESWEISERAIVSSCVTTEPGKGCELEGQPANIELNPLTGTPTKGTASADRITYKPQTKGVLAELNFGESNTCAFAGEEVLKGSYTLALPTGQSENVIQAAEALGSVENNSLELGAGNKVLIEGGKILLKLASGLKWSFH